MLYDSSLLIMNAKIRIQNFLAVLKKSKVNFLLEVMLFL